MSINILEIDNLKVYFPIRGELLPKIVGNVKAVDGISFEIRKEETIGLVGESGCGKTTVARAILRLEEASGRVIFEKRDLLTLNKKELKPVRKKIQLVFQDPFSSLNPKMTIGSVFEEILKTHRIGNNTKTRKARAVELLDMVGLTKSYLSRYPHEFSGGQRQRIVIARALAVEPTLIICDEPVSALDVSIKSQIINLLEELQDSLKLTYLFISHDLGIVRYISDRIVVMYLGIIVELADRESLFNKPLHPYTKALLSAIPVFDPDVVTEKIILEGDIPSPVNPPSGCRFHTRCYKAMEICSVEEPKFKEKENGHFIACHFY
ncbi:MAG: ABC transporter ATP-binding protein [Bacillota bacterium]